MNYIWLVPGPKSLTLANYTYTYDKSGNATSYQDAASSLTYRYDQTGQLLSASGTLNGSSYSASWSYDANGNRTMPGYQTGAGNELLNDGTYTYTYDQNGNTLTKTNTATGDQWQYRWDYHNQLVEAVEKTKDGVVENDEKFIYDIKGRLIGVVINGVQQRWTVFDGANVYLDFNGAGTGVAARYLTSPGSYGTLYARVSADGTVSWYITDLLGSVRQIVDTSGNVLDAIVYDPWGNIVSESNPANGDRFKYAGGQYDALQQTYLFTARWENPQEGRWQSLDPIGFLAGDVNLYRYVFNSPATYNDPIGEGITGRITSIVAKLGTKIIATLVGGNLKKKVDLSRYEDERITFVITAEVRKTGNDDPRQYNVILASDSFYITPFAADWGRGNPVPRDFWDIEASNFSKLNIGACESGEYTPPLTTKVRLDAVDNIQYPHWIMAWLYYYYALRVCNCGNTRLAFGGPVFLDIKQDQWMPGKQKVKVWPPNFEGAI